MPAHHPRLITHHYSQMQFSLKTLMFVVLAAAMVCGIFFGLTVWLSVIVLWILTALLPAILIPSIVYGSGYGRAFAIGAMTCGLCVPGLNIVMLVLLLETGLPGFLKKAFDGAGEPWVSQLLPFAIVHVWIAMSGLLSIAVRWMLIERPQPVALTESPAQETPAQENATPQPYLILHGRATAAPLERTNLVR